MGDPAPLPPLQEQFTYQPLDDTAHSIRLLRIAPAQADERIRISMTHSDMQAEYSCLSYMWGTGSTDHDIVINGYTSGVRENLYRFLRMASHRFPDQLLWIDALCINQADNTEKGIQVERMGEIYRSGQRTLVWLGDKSDLSHVFDWAKAQPKVDSRSRKSAVLNANFTMRLGNYTPDSVYEGIKTLLTDPYWYRTWIAQEILLARTVRLLHSFHEMDFFDFGFLLFHHEKLVSLGRDHPQARRLFQASLVSQDDSHRRNYPFNSLLYWRFNSQCTDVRDRIYGLCALTTDRRFPVDYREDIVSLFWRAGEHFHLWESANGVTALRRTLNLSVKQLEENVKQAISSELSFRVACVPLTTIPSTDSKTIRTLERTCKCCSGAMLAPKGPAVLFCVSGVSNDNSSSLLRNWHVAVDDSLHVNIILDDKNSNVCFFKSPTATVLMCHRDDATIQEVTTWGMLQKMHRACLQGLNHVCVKIRVPAAFIVDTLKMGQSGEIP